jgi:hypothetical protein
VRADGTFHLTDFASWRGCDYRYWLEVVRGEPRATLSPWALNGTAIHRVIDQLHHSGFGWDLPTLYAEAFDHAVRNPTRKDEESLPIAWGPDGRDAVLERMAADALMMLRGYAADPRNREAFVVAGHSQWRMEIDGAPWAGEIDQIRAEGDGTMTVVDLKSGREAPRGPSLELWTQLGYAIALSEAEFRHTGDEARPEWKRLGLEVGRVVWLHLRDYEPYIRIPPDKRATYVPGSPRGQVYYEIPISAAAVAAMRREMSLFVGAVRRGEFPRRPSPYECSRCHVADRCLAGYRGTIVGQEIAEDAYAEE